MGREPTREGRSTRRDSHCEDERHSDSRSARDLRRLEALVTRLDSRVRAGEVSWKNAHNVWGLITRQFSDAQSSKQTDLRVARADNPTTGVRGPDRGARKAKQFLWPSEFRSEERR